MKKMQQDAFSVKYPNFTSQGCTKLELFTAMAMHGLCSLASATWQIDQKDIGEIGVKAKQIAEATLKQLP